MYIYLSVTFLSLILICMSGSKNKKKYLIKFNNFYFTLNLKKVILFLDFIPLTIVSAIRYEVGTDYASTYKSIFLKIQDGNSIRDIGYGFINKIFLIFTKDYVWVLFMCSILFFYFFVNAISEFSESYKCSLLLFVFTNVYFISMNMVRQTLGTAIFLYSVKYIKEKNIIKYFFWIAIATSIHTMCFIYFFIYFIDKIKIEKVVIKKVIFVSILGAFGMCIYLYLGRFVNYIVTKISILQNYFGWYYNSFYNTNEFNYISLLINLFILILCLLIVNKDNIDWEFKFFLILQCIVVMILFCSNVIPLAQRISRMFSFSQVIFLPNIINKINDSKMVLLVKMITIISFFLYMIFTISMKGYEGVLPYHTIFNR